MKRRGARNPPTGLGEQGRSTSGKVWAPNEPLLHLQHISTLLRDCWHCQGHLGSDCREAALNSMTGGVKYQHLDTADSAPPPAAAPAPLQPTPSTESQNGGDELHKERQWASAGESLAVANKAQKVGGLGGAAGI